MKKLTVDEILQIVKEKGFTIEEFAYGDLTIPNDFIFSEEVKKAEIENKKLADAFHQHPSAKLPYKERLLDLSYEAARIACAMGPNPYKQKQKEYLESIGIGDFEEIDQYGGEGQGNTWYSIKYFKDHDVYIKTEGYYQSYDGTTFHDGYGVEVFPKQKTITVYETTKS